MKTHILQLEPYDDIISARDKMGWGKAGRVLLVWPERGRILNRRLDLVLLQRHSLSLGAQLALVTRDPEVRYHAPRLGIPVFKTLRKAQSAHWRVPRRFRKAQVDTTEILWDDSKPSSPAGERPQRGALPPRPTREPVHFHPVTRLIFFTLGVLAFLAITAVLLPGAEVTLTPKTQDQDVTIDVRAGSKAPTVNLSGAVPARQVTVIVEGRDSLPASGSMQVSDRPAIGYGHFTNLTDQPVDVPEGTVVLSQGPGAVRFIVTQAGTVPAGPGETLSLPVRALVPGSSGNLPPNSLVAIDDFLGTQVAVTNLLPIRHGSDRQDLAPSEADRRQLSKQLRDSLRQTALKELEDSLAPGDLLLLSSFNLLNVLEEDFQPAELQPADQLDLNLRLEFQALVVSRNNLNALAEAVLDANLPAGYIPVEDSLEIENLTEPVFDDDSIARWKMYTRRQLKAELLENQAIRLSMGLAPTQAIGRLMSALSLAEPPQIVLIPYWWPRLPILPFRIMIVQ